MSQEQPTYYINSKQSLFSLNLKEVWAYRDLLYMLVKRDFVTFYKQTVLGPLWFIVQPLLTTVIYIILFGNIAKLSTDGLPQILFYLSGITVWNYFSESLTKTSTVFTANAGMFGKVYFPRLIMPLSIVASALMKFAVQFGIFLAVLLYYVLFTDTVHPNSWILLTPLLILLMAMFALGMGMIFSSLTTKYKDLTFLLTFGTQLFMYITPVVYPISALPEKLRFLAVFNPLSSVFECFRYAFLGAGSFDLMNLIWSSIFIFALLIIGTVIFNKVEKSFMDTV
ncbi:ABC transporter permease [Chryseobacterium koreense]|uniref:Transport permease protein n=1 Tax=Chryseobacterium koreense CCUG 49689 TaxID=1304281 RepID=A0A0J7IX74_9FLAO|nr:ABC transporter permease [Chryseobacterium koreense]KMQ70414.1 ABC transporter permease [Chryseobacterium koreense CCUG 49689]MBB5333559.1 lipopolysaccharide transport system permease protein [Chryseobacterium koreense]